MTQQSQLTKDRSEVYLVNEAFNSFEELVKGMYSSIINELQQQFSFSADELEEIKLTTYGSRKKILLTRKDKIVANPAHIQKNVTEQMTQELVQEDNHRSTPAPIEPVASKSLYHTNDLHPHIDATTSVSLDTTSASNLAGNKSRESVSGSGEHPSNTSSLGPSSSVISPSLSTSLGSGFDYSTDTPALPEDQSPEAVSLDVFGPTSSIQYESDRTISDITDQNVEWAIKALNGITFTCTYNLPEEFDYDRYEQSNAPDQLSQRRLFFNRMFEIILRRLGLYELLGGDAEKYIKYLKNINPRGDNNLTAAEVMHHFLSTFRVKIEERIVKLISEYDNPIAFNREFCTQ